MQCQIILSIGNLTPLWPAVKYKLLSFVLDCRMRQMNYTVMSEEDISWQCSINGGNSSLRFKVGRSSNDIVPGLIVRCDLVILKAVWYWKKNRPWYFCIWKYSIAGLDSGKNSLEYCQNWPGFANFWSIGDISRIKIAWYPMIYINILRYVPCLVYYLNLIIASGNFEILWCEMWYLIAVQP